MKIINEYNNALKEYNMEDYIEIYKKYSNITLGHGRGGYTPLNALVEFKIDSDFVKNYIVKSFETYTYYTLYDYSSEFIDELVEYTQARLHLTTPDYSCVDIGRICEDIEKSFPMISCVITKIPDIAYTYIPEKPDINIHDTRINAIIEKMEQDEREM